jgi:hypothetical protein
MQAKSFPLLATLSLTVFAIPALGQATGSGRTPVQHAPFTAEFKLTSVQTLADGTTITRETTEVQARDSSSRSMTSITDPTSGAHPSVTRITVNDPVANVRISWNSLIKRAREVQLPPGDQQGCWSSDSGQFSIARGNPEPGAAAAHPPRPASPVAGAPGVPANVVHNNPPVMEDLGTAEFQGVEALGNRNTWTIPAGEVGNDRPMVRSGECWRAPGVGGLVVHSVDNAPRSGKRTRDLVRMDLAEPDPSVFQPPADYEVSTEQVHEGGCNSAPVAPR